MPSPSDAVKFIIFGKAKLPQCLKDTRLLPFKKSGVNGAGTAVTLARQCLPLTKEKEKERKFNRTIQTKLPLRAPVNPIFIVKTMTDTTPRQLP